LCVQANSQELPGKEANGAEPVGKSAGGAQPAKNPQKIRPFYQCKSSLIMKLGAGNEENRVFGRERAISPGFARQRASLCAAAEGRFETWIRKWRRRILSQDGVTKLCRKLGFCLTSAGNPLKVVNRWLSANYGAF